MRLLVVTAVAAEADAVRAGLAAAGTAADSRAGTHADIGAGTHADSGAGDPAGRAVGIVVEPVGVGPAAAAAGTARLLAGNPYTAVISAGIAGGFPGRADVGAIVIGARSIAADLGAESPDGFLPLERLGFGSSTRDADPELLRSLTAALPDAVVGDILTLATVTGTAETTERLTRTHPAAVAEAMEGFGAATAAGHLPFIEIRAVSNPIGPRDRAAWRLPEALAALTRAATRLPALSGHTCRAATDVASA
jgi:futalosine hydrolase